MRCSFEGITGAPGAAFIREGEDVGNLFGRAAVLAAAVLAFALLLAPAGGARAGQACITVAGASDLAFAFKEIAAVFERETGCAVALSLGSTGMLARQIEHGAPFDAFFSASAAYMDDLSAKGLVVPDSAALYARGRIVLAVRKGSGVEAAGLADLARGSYRIAIANPEHAPYGKAAMEALRSAGLWDGLRPRLVYGENIRQALQFVQSGNAPVGVIALSIADVPEITHTLISEAMHRPIDQVAAVVKASKSPGEAGQFIRFVLGPKGRPIMKKYGFVLPEAGK